MGTRTYVMMEVSAATYDELRGKLEAAHYEHAIHDDGALDMHGIAIERPKDHAAPVARSVFDRLVAATEHCRSCRDCGDGPCCAHCDVAAAIAAAR